MDNKDMDSLTYNFDEMSTSDLVMWLETHRDTDKICNKMYWDLDYVCKKWVKEMYQLVQNYGGVLFLSEMENMYNEQLNKLQDIGDEFLWT
jgi:hypothetical protein